MSPQYMEWYKVSRVHHNCHNDCIIYFYKLGSYRRINNKFLPDLFINPAGIMTSFLRHSNSAYCFFYPALIHGLVPRKHFSNSS